jgi:hypothetical protein
LSACIQRLQKKDSKRMLCMQMATFLRQTEIQRILNLWLHGALMSILTLAGTTHLVGDIGTMLLTYRAHEEEWRDVRHLNQ